MSDMHGTVAWTELMTPDVEAVRGFYARICGWSFDSMAMPGGAEYLLGMTGGKPVAGIMDTSKVEGGAQMPHGWFTYFAVDDVDAAVDAVRKAGGQVMRPPFEIPGVGRIAIVADPGGAELGLMTPA